jgi:hypothetical protein
VAGGNEKEEAESCYKQFHHDIHLTQHCNDEAGARKIFEFAKKTNVYGIIIEAVGSLLGKNYPRV